MRHEDAGLALWVAAHQTSRGRETHRHKALLAPERRAAQSLRRRVGGAFIALGERLAGEPRPATRRRLVRQAS